MNTLWSVFAISMGLAYLSEKNAICLRIMKTKRIDLALVTLIIILSLFCGLRTSYNDTYTYIVGFNNAPTPSEYLSTNPTLFDNPGFYLFQAVFRHHISDNYHLFFVIIAFFTITSFVLFIKKYASEFTFSFFLFFVLLYLLPFAAVKQALAMAILCFAVNKMHKGNLFQFFILVFVAVLFHSYAFIFFLLPIFKGKPWSGMTYASIAATFLVIFTFDSFIQYLFNITDGLGKDLEASTILSETGMNILRVAVFSVPPLVSFIFRRRIGKYATEANALMINMCIISWLIVCMGAISAANMFGRLSLYFIMGTIIGFPWVLRAVFEHKSKNVIKAIAYCCYFIFFYVDTQYFRDGYRAINFIDFINSLIH